MPDRAFIYELVTWFGFLLSAGFGNPVPEEVMITLGGVRTAQMASRHAPWHWLMFPACLLGGIGADLILYALGRIFGARLMETSLMQRLAPVQKQDQIKANFERYGIVIFVLGRLVPGIRTTLFLTAGTMRLSVIRFLIADGVGAFFGAGIFFLLGYGLGSQFEDLIKRWEQEIHPYRPIILLSLLFAVAGYLTYTFFRHPIPTGDPEEVPLIGHQIATHMHHLPSVDGHVNHADVVTESAAVLPEQKH